MKGATTGAMVTGIVAGYGSCAAIAARFLYPPGKEAQRWVFVADVNRIPPGGSLLFSAPSGATINVARQGELGDATDFIALSSVCPHLGCQVHWEGHNSRFFCPCHNGVFDPTGEATEGPPAEAGQSLDRYDLEVREGGLYIALGPTDLGLAEGGDPPSEPALEEVAPLELRGPGHDPCLTALAPRAHRKEI